MYMKSSFYVSNQRVWESELIQSMLLFSMALSVEAKRTGQRVPKGFSAPGISLIWIKLGIRSFRQNRGARFGIENMLGWDAKNNLWKTGLHEILGRDYGIEEHYGRPSGHTRTSLNSSWIVYNDNSRSSSLIQCSPGRIRQWRIVFFLTSNSQIL